METVNSTSGFVTIVDGNELKKAKYYKGENAVGYLPHRKNPS
jgi:hypothetical protein